MLPGCRIALLVALTSLTVARQVAGQGAAVPVRGIAYDSLNRAPLTGAVITIVGTARSTKTDADGRFQFDSVRPGTHTFAAQHAALDSLGFSGVSARATVNDGLTEVRLGSPSFATLWRRACGDTRPPKDSGFVYGTVRDATSGSPAPNAIVDITWIDLKVTKRLRISETRWRGRSVTGDAGDFAVCGVPLDVGLRIIAVTDSAASGLIQLPVREARVQRRDLLVGLVTDDSAGPGRGTIVGLVTDSSGRPVPEARVVADGVPELRTDSAGRFTVRHVPIGSRQVEVLAIGMSPVVSVVDVTAADTATVFATMRRITTLDVVRVTASPLARKLARDLDDRRKVGTGYVRDSTEIAAHGTLASVFYTFPSVEVRRTGMGHDFILTLPLGAGRCPANLLIDGRQATHDELQFYRPSDIAAVEVYPRRLSAPGQFVRDNPCGVVVLWTKWAFGG